MFPQVRESGVTESRPLTRRPPALPERVGAELAGSPWAQCRVRDGRRMRNSPVVGYDNPSSATRTTGASRWKTVAPRVPIATATLVGAVEPCGRRHAFRGFDRRGGGRSLDAHRVIPPGTLLARADHRVRDVAEWPRCDGEVKSLDLHRPRYQYSTTPRAGARRSIDRDAIGSDDHRRTDAMRCYDMPLLPTRSVIAACAAEAAPLPH